MKSKRSKISLFLSLLAFSVSVGLGFLWGGSDAAREILFIADRLFSMVAPIESLNLFLFLLLLDLLLLAFFVLSSFLLSLPSLFYLSFYSFLTGAAVRISGVSPVFFLLFPFSIFKILPLILATFFCLQFSGTLVLEVFSDQFTFPKKEAKVFLKKIVLLFLLFAFFNFLEVWGVSFVFRFFT